MIEEFFFSHKLFSCLGILWIFCSLITWILYALDKRKSIQNAQRISEKTLLLWSLVGSLGALCAIFITRHKSAHIYFPIIAIQSLFLEGVILYALY